MVLGSLELEHLPALDPSCSKDIHGSEMKEKPVSFLSRPIQIRNWSVTLLTNYTKDCLMVCRQPFLR